MISDWHGKFAGIAFIWCISCLLFQLIKSRKRGADYSSPVVSANIFRAIIYNFTLAMSPLYKESAKLYPLKFILGIIMHIGVLAAFLQFLCLMFSTTSNCLVSLIIFSVSSLASFLLLLNRMFSKELRSISCIDDYFSIIITMLLLISAGLNQIDILSKELLLIIFALVFFYVPLGKLRHAVFFFAVRIDLAKRLGSRGVYPL